MKICFCVDTMNSGGAERVVATLSNQLIVDGHEVCIVMVAARQLFSFYTLDDNIELEALCKGANNRINAIKRVKLLRNYFKDKRPDAVISFLPNANIYTMLAIHGLKILHIVSERNNPYIDPQNKFIRYLKKKAFIKADGCVFQTEDALNFYPNSVKKKGIVIYNPISIQVDNCSNIMRNNYILSVGRLTKQKNIKLLLSSFSKFHAEYDDYKLVVYGDGEEKGILKNYCENLNISDIVEFRGNSQTWQKEACDAKMFVLCSDYEGMPNALMEAMAIGIPCISTDCPIGGPRELIKNSENGFLIKVGDEIELTNKMVEIVESKDISDKFSEANKNMKINMSAENICKQWIEYIDRVKC